LWFPAWPGIASTSPDGAAWTLDSYYCLGRDTAGYFFSSFNAQGSDYVSYGAGPDSAIRGQIGHNTYVLCSLPSSFSLVGFVRQLTFNPASPWFKPQLYLPLGPSSPIMNNAVAGVEPPFATDPDPIAAIFGAFGDCAAHGITLPSSLNTEYAGFVSDWNSNQYAMTGIIFIGTLGQDFTGFDNFYLRSPWTATGSSSTRRLNLQSISVCDCYTGSPVLSFTSPGDLMAALC